MYRYTAVKMLKAKDRETVLKAATTKSLHAATKKSTHATKRSRILQ